MKILHICMSQYSDGWTYQENMLAKYHKLAGYDVTILTSMYCYNMGRLMEDDKIKFVDCNGCDVIRLKKKKSIFEKKLPRYEGFFSALKKVNPDIIFSHGCQYIDIKLVKKYLNQKENVKLYIDNHADFSNSATNFLSKKILHGIIWKHYANLIEPETKQFWGVLPARVDFLTNVYKLPKNKCKLLVMGGDDELIALANDDKKIKSLRKKWSISKNDFLIVTGGKIDNAKQEVLLLMKAVKLLNNNKIKLLVFGSIADNLKNEVDKLTDGNIIQQVGWINGSDSYNYFAMANLVVYPGRHSVFWEQTVAQGIPLIVKKWEGTEHVNVCDNAIIMQNVSVDELRKKINDLFSNKEMYNAIKINAKKAMREFSYKRIAEKSIEMYS